MRQVLVAAYKKVEAKCSPDWYEASAADVGGMGVYDTFEQCLRRIDAILRPLNMQIQKRKAETKNAEGDQRQASEAEKDPESHAATPASNPPPSQGTTGVERRRRGANDEDQKAAKGKVTHFKFVHPTRHGRALRVVQVRCHTVGAALCTARRDATRTRRCDPLGWSSVSAGPAL